MLKCRPHRLAERKLKMRQAQSEARKEIDEYRASREAKLRSVQPEVRAHHRARGRDKSSPIDARA